MANANILVTGATGTTGGAVVRHLSRSGIAARALTRSAAKGPSLPHIETAVGDLGDPASLKAAFEGIDAVYLNVVPGPGALTQIDNAIAAAKTAGAKTIVKLSGLHATPESASAIIRMHAEADRRVRTSGVSYAILRANSFFQNIESQFAAIKEHGKFYLPMSDARQSLIDVEDIAAVAVKAIIDPAFHNRDFDLTGPEALSFADVADKLSAAGGKTVSYVPISNETFGQNLRNVGVPPAAADSVAELMTVFATGIYAATTGDVRMALGREPTKYDAYAKRLFA